MKQKLLLILFILSFQVYSSLGQQLYNREFRGAWIATVANMDWPVAGASAESQKTALRNQLDKIKEANLNVVFFQVRPEADALYNSTKEPWSRFLTGTQGQDPGYDPLAFAIEEAHKRGLELHAWFNPYRVNYSTSSSITYDPQHVSNSKPEWLLNVNGKKILNPGIPAVRDYVTSVVMEVVDNYNIDGVHFDDYFYQYPPDQITNQDDATFQQYGSGFANRGDWRRDNVNKLMKQINDGINASKPQVRFGISPFGLYRNGVPAGTSGMDAYNTIYADPLNWLQNQYIDYLTPQLYWVIGGGQDFRKLVDWWSTQAYQNNRHLYSGHILNSTFSKEELPNQIKITREPQYRAKNSLGSVFFRSSLVANNTLGLFENLKNEIYRYPAIPPVMEWKQGDAPAAPTNAVATLNEQTGEYVITWTRNPANTYEFKRIVMYELNSAEATTVAAIPDGSVRVLTGQDQIVIPAISLPQGASHFVLTELSPTNRESELSNVVTINKSEAGPSAPVVTLPTSQSTGTTNTYQRFEWNKTDDMQGFHYQWSTSETFATTIEDNNQVPVNNRIKVFAYFQPNTTYYFRIRAKNMLSWGEWSPTYRVDVWPLGISELVDEDKITVYPNPADGPFFVGLHLKKAANVRAELFSMDGQNRLKTASKKYTQGDQTIKINRGSLPAGVYVLKLSINGEVSTHRVVLM